MRTSTCCGERAAFLQLAGRAGVSVRACYITTDAPYPVTSGALCREYMLSQSWLTTPQMPVVTEGGDGRRYTIAFYKLADGSGWVRGRSTPTAAPRRYICRGRS